MAKVVATKARSAAGGITAPAAYAKNPTPPAVGNNESVFRSGYGRPPGQIGHASSSSIAAQEKAQAIAAGKSVYAPPPWESAYEKSVAGAEAKYTNAGLNAGYKKQAYEQEYGLDPGYNDYKANPYSRAALLQQSYERSGRASSNSLASAGQLYSGASQNAETYNRAHDAQERSSLEGTYRKALQGVVEEEAGALAAREEEIANAGWKRLEAAQNAPLEPLPNARKEQAGGMTGKTSKGKKIGISGARKA